MYYLLGRSGRSLLQEVSAFKIHIQILQIDLDTFLLRIVERIWFKIPVLLIMNLAILITFTLDDLVMLLGENWWWPLLGPKGLKMRAIIQRFVRKQVSLKSPGYIILTGWTSNGYSKLGNLSAIHTFHITHNASCLNLPLTYFHIRIVFNPPYGKGWRLYILSQFLSNLTRFIYYFGGRNSSL